MKRKRLNEQAMSSLAQIERQASEMAKGFSSGAMQMKGEVESGGFLNTIAGFFRSVGIVDPCDFVEKNRSELEGQERELTTVMDKLRALESGQINDGLTTLAAIVGGLGAGSLGYYAYKRYEPRIDWAVANGKSTLDTLEKVGNLKSGAGDMLGKIGINLPEGKLSLSSLLLEQMPETGVWMARDPQVYGFHVDQAKKAGASDEEAYKQAQKYQDDITKGAAKAGREFVIPALKMVDPTGISGWPDLARSISAYRDGSGSGSDVIWNVVGVIPFIKPVSGMAKTGRAYRAGRATQKAKNSWMAGKARQAIETVKEIPRKAPGDHTLFTSKPGAILAGLGGEIKHIDDMVPELGKAIRWLDRNPGLVNATGYGGYALTNAGMEKLQNLTEDERKWVEELIGTRNEVAQQAAEKLKDLPQQIPQVLPSLKDALDDDGQVTAMPGLGNPSEAWYSIGKAMVITAGLLLVYRALIKLVPGPMCSIKEFIVDVGSSIASGISSLYDSFVQPVVDYIRDLAASAWESLSSMFSSDDEMAPVTEAYRVIKEWNDINDSMTIFNISSRVLI